MVNAWLALPAFSNLKTCLFTVIHYSFYIFDYSQWNPIASSLQSANHHSRKQLYEHLGAMIMGAAADMAVDIPCIAVFDAVAQLLL